MTSSNYPEPIDHLYRQHKALMDRAAENEMAEMFHRERLVQPVPDGHNRADRRRKAALARRAKP